VLPGPSAEDSPGNSGGAERINNPPVMAVAGTHGNGRNRCELGETRAGNFSFERFRAHAVNPVELLDRRARRLRIRTPGGRD
jgi:hypothetical protein